MQGFLQLKVTPLRTQLSFAKPPVQLNLSFENHRRKSLGRLVLRFNTDIHEEILILNAIKEEIFW